jgi:murein DD-endopeptidase MepM/ murein hydrolase activator NlpD
MPKLAKLTFALLLAASLPAHASGTPDSPDQSATSSAPSAPASPSASRWHLPLDVAKVSSFFGALRGKRAHGGVDFSTPTGTPIKATDGGTVVASTNRYEGDKKYGEVVVIEHQNGLRSLYAHLKERLVRVGDIVSSGELIGRSGMTGHSTGPHLHLEAFQDGKRIDPQNLLDKPLEENALAQALNAKRAGEADAVYSSPRIEARAGKHGRAHSARHGGAKAATTKAPARHKAVAGKSSGKHKHR